TINRPARNPIIPSVLPAPTLRGQAAEISGSLAMAAVFSAIATILWSALGRIGMERLNDIGVLFFLTVATCWAVIIPAKFWGQRRGDSWMRRVIMMGVGLCIGLTALYLDGWIPNLPTSEIPSSSSAKTV